MTRWRLASPGRLDIGQFFDTGGALALPPVRADGDVVVLKTRFFADEMRDPRQEISNLPRSVDLSSQEVQIASHLIEAMTGPWKPAGYRAAYTDRVTSSSRRREQEGVRARGAGPGGSSVASASAVLPPEGVDTPPDLARRTVRRDIGEI